jgi:hypothetical protein
MDGEAAAFESGDLAAPGARLRRAVATDEAVGHLLHIGFSKTGSKYLQRWFETNPQLAFAQWGLAGAPDALELIQRVVYADYRYYVTSCEAFVNPVRGYHHFDFRPGLIPTRAGQMRMCRFLAGIFRAPRILAVTRGFRGIIWSTYAEMVRNGAAYSFEDFCRWLERDIDRGRNPLDYDFILGAYAEAFGDDNLIVLPYELLQRDPELFIFELEKALGLDPHPPPERRIHTSFASRQVYWYPRIARLVKSLPMGPRLRRRAFAAYVGAARRDRLGSLIRLLDRVRPASPMSEALVPDALIARFRGTTQCLRGRPLYRGLDEDYAF